MRCSTHFVGCCAQDVQAIASPEAQDAFIAQHTQRHCCCGRAACTCTGRLGYYEGIAPRWRSTSTHQMA